MAAIGEIFIQYASAPSPTLGPKVTDGFSLAGGLKFREHLTTRPSAVWKIMKNKPRGLQLNIDNDLFNITLLAIVWGLMVWMVNPIGEFPLNDDRAYGWVVKNLLETGRFEPSDWTSSNLISQVLFGALFCLTSGFSFTALRFSTVVLGFLGLLGTYGLLREAFARPRISLLGALTVAVNPLYFMLSNSFMNDVPAFTVSILSICFLIRGLKHSSWFSLSVGVLLAFVAILNRQSSLIILPAFSLAYIVKKGVKLHTVVEALTPTILGVAVYIGYAKWLILSGKAPTLYNLQIEQITASLSQGFQHLALTYVTNFVIILIYLGMLLFPFLVVGAYAQYRCLSSRRKRGVLAATFVVAILAALAAKYWRMPLTGNVLVFFGVGPQDPRGYESVLGPNSIALVHRGWQILTATGVVGAALLSQYLLRAMLQVTHKSGLSPDAVFAEEKWLGIFIISIVCLYVAPIGALPTAYWFDRYLIFLLPLLMAVVSGVTAGREKDIGIGAVSLAVGLVLLYGVVTIGGTHDYLAAQRVRWEALNGLMRERHISPSQIDGGFEFNGWYFGNKLEACNPEYGSSGNLRRVTWDDFRCLTDSNKSEFTVSFVPRDGYVIEKWYVFKWWLPWADQNIFILRKRAGTLGAG
jgi:hypothetical protein